MRTRLRMAGPARRRLSLAAGATVLAFGAIVLARAHGQADQSSEPGVLAASTAAPAGPTRVNVSTPELEGFVALTQGAVLQHGTRELFASLRLEARSGVEGAVERRPVALAVVLDTSGSMSGEKIQQARNAVHALAARMRPEDQLAVIAYDNVARIVQGLAPLGHARETLVGSVASIQAGGGTNIPSGLTLGSSVLEGAPATHIRRLVLISDGLDGSGLALSSVGYQISSRANGGVTTSALGVGTDYDERWLTTVADAGRGNYEFLARGGELHAFLARELEQASTTVADRAVVDLSLPSGWRVAEVYGGTLDGGRLPIGSLFAGEQRRITVRLEVDAGAAGHTTSLPVALRYRSPVHAVDRNLDLGRLSLDVVGDEAQVVASRDVRLHAEVVAQRVDIVQAQAVDAWRAGDQAEAERLTQGNIATLARWQAEAPQAAAALDPRMEAVNEDLGNFRQVRAASEEGRAYGLRSNARRRRRVEGL